MEPEAARAPPSRARRLAGRVTASRNSQVHRSSYALMLTTLVNAALGLLFWVAAARLYPASVVGLGAGGISALQLVATVGWVGLIFTLMRYVPIAGRARRRVILGAYASGISAALLLGIVLTVAVPSALSVPYATRSILTSAIFCLCVGGWVVFTLQDATLISLRRSPMVTAENLLYGVLKLVMLVALSAIARPWTLLGIWAGVAMLFVVAVNIFVLFIDPRVRTPDTSGVLLSKRTLARFSTGHTAAALVFSVPDYLVPLLILHYLGANANAYYFTAMSVGFSARALSINVTDALMVEAAYGEESFGELLRKVAALFASVLIPTILFLGIGAGLILQIFGSRYAAEGAVVLRFLAVGLIPFTVVTLALVLDRVRERFVDALLITSVATVSTIGLDTVLIPSHGLAGAGLGWLCGQTLAALVAVRTLWHGLRH